MRLQIETVVALGQIPVGSQNYHAAQLGKEQGEPLLWAMDGLLRYAKAYRQRMGQPLAEDWVLGDHWLATVRGLRALLNGDGAVAMERDISTDSKDNGAIESMFWVALGIAGYSEKDLT
jgi:hypothetical protein